jgi:hypothetical protein
MAEPANCGGAAGVKGGTRKSGRGSSASAINDDAPVSACPARVLGNLQRGVVAVRCLAGNFGRRKVKARLRDRSLQSERGGERMLWTMFLGWLTQPKLSIVNDVVSEAPVSRFPFGGHLHEHRFVTIDVVVDDHFALGGVQAVKSATSSAQFVPSPAAERVRGDEVFVAKVRRYVEQTLTDFAENCQLLNERHGALLGKLREVLGATAAAMFWE